MIGGSANRARGGETALRWRERVRWSERENSSYGRKNPAIGDYLFYILIF